MNYIKCPCHGCEERHVGCHGNCRKYDEWKGKDMKIKKKIKAENELLSMEINNRMKNAARRKRK